MMWQRVKPNEADHDEERRGGIYMPRKSVKKPSALNALKRNIAGVFGILNDVKKVKPNQWKSPSHVEQLARKYIDKMGISVPEQRIKQFMDAYQDAIRNGLSADELIQKYGNNVDEGTVKTLKEYVSIKMNIKPRYGRGNCIPPVFVVLTLEVIGRNDYIRRLGAELLYVSLLH